MGGFNLGLSWAIAQSKPSKKILAPHIFSPNTANHFRFFSPLAQDSRKYTTQAHYPLNLSLPEYSLSLTQSRTHALSSLSSLSSLYSAPDFTLKDSVTQRPTPTPATRSNHLFLFIRLAVPTAQTSSSSSSSSSEMVIPLPVRPPRVIKFLKPYVLKMHFTNKYVNAQVIHSPTATVASSASSQENALRSSMESTRDVAAAGKIGKILGERLLFKGIPAVSIFLKREQKYHGKVKAVIDSLREAGVKLL